MGISRDRSPGRSDWHEYVWGEELERFSLDQAQEVGALLFGRKTYEGMAGYWETATGEVADFMNSVPKVVFSNSLEKTDWRNTRLVKGPAKGEVARIVIRPTNNRLLGLNAEKDPGKAIMLQNRWNRLHMVRSAPSLAALIIFLVQTVVM